MCYNCCHLQSSLRSTAHEYRSFLCLLETAEAGLGMTLASRAYGPESRGTVLGVIAATIGLGAAAGPLLGGALSESLGWESLFFINVAAAVTIPLGLKILPKDEERSGGGIDLFGWVALGLLVGGVLLIPSEGARSGWA